MPEMYLLRPSNISRDTELRCVATSYVDSSLKRKATGFATSSGLPSLPNAHGFKIGVVAILVAAAFIGVLILPGQKQFTRMLRLPNSFAALLVKPSTACLAAEYEAFFALPVRPAIEQAFTIDPPSLIT
jgi:hypothetical protein